MLNYCHTVVACVDFCLSALLNQLGENNVSSSTQDNKHLFSVSLRIAMHHLLARTPPRQEAACRARIENVGRHDIAVVIHPHDIALAAHGHRA